MTPIISVNGIEPEKIPQLALPTPFFWEKGTEAFTTAVRQCQQVRKVFPLVEYRCPCGMRLVPRLARSKGKQTGQMSSWPQAVHHSKTGCLCSTLTRKRPLNDLKHLDSIESAFPSVDDESLARLRLRLAPAHASIMRSLDAGAADRSVTGGRKSSYLTKTLGGLLDLFAENSRTCVYEPPRRYCTQFAAFLPWLSEQSMMDQALANNFERKTVFASVVPELKAAIVSACDSNETALKNLAGKAIVVFSGAYTPPSSGQSSSKINVLCRSTCFEVSPAVAKRLAEPSTKRLIEITSGTGTHARLAIISLVQRDGEKLVLTDAAWRLIDRFGIGYESVWEFHAGQELIMAGCRFVKPPSTLYRVGRARQRPDFVAFDVGGKRFIIEIDPSSSKKTAERKMQRDESYRAEGIAFVSWNPRKDGSLIEKLKASGFQIR